MRTLGVCLFLVLSACGINDAHANSGVLEPVYPPYCWAQPAGSTLWYPCDSQELKDANCLSLMETAMKEIDPYVTALSAGDLSLLDGTERMTKTLKVWDRAKNGCWSDLKDLQPQHYH
jgi:hypothetical protein